MASLPKLIGVYKRGHFDFRHIDSMSYGKTLFQFHKEGIKIPSWERLGSYGKRSDLRILLSDLTIYVEFTNKTGFQYLFKRGYITDLGSVPAYFRSFVDNDDIDMLAAALVHDRNFSVHILSFEETNELFYKMFLTRKGIPGSDEKWLSLPRRARLAWRAVSSPIGRILWDKNQKRRRTWTLNTSHLSRLNYDKKP